MGPRSLTLQHAAARLAAPRGRRVPETGLPSILTSRAHSWGIPDRTGRLSLLRVRIFSAGTGRCDAVVRWRRRSIAARSSSNGAQAARALRRRRAAASISSACSSFLHSVPWQTRFVGRRISSPNPLVAPSRQPMAYVRAWSPELRRRIRAVAVVDAARRPRPTDRRPGADSFSSIQRRDAQCSSSASGPGTRTGTSTT